MPFSHPLARDAKVWRTAGIKGKIRPLLVIVTTLELDRDHKKFNADKVEQLSVAARDWIENNPAEASDFLLMNRPKTWAGDKG